MQLADKVFAVTGGSRGIGRGIVKRLVNCISPGWIATSEYLARDKRHPPELSKADHAQHPAGRVGKPEDIAGLCAYLLSAEAGFVTGANFTVDGGMTRKMIYA